MDHRDTYIDGCCNSTRDALNARPVKSIANANDQNLFRLGRVCAVAVSFWCDLRATFIPSHPGDNTNPPHEQGGLGPGARCLLSPTVPCFVFF
jgi:hypothetical protein